MAGKFGLEADEASGVRLTLAAEPLSPFCMDEAEVDWQIANLMADLEATAQEMKAALAALANVSAQ